MSPRVATARRGRSARGSSATTGSSAARPTNGIRTWSRTIISSSRPSTPEQGYHLSKDLADQAIKMMRNQQAAPLEARGSCFTTRAPTTPRTTLRRSTSPSTRASLTTATRPTAPGCWRAWSRRASCRRTRSSPRSIRCPKSMANPADNVRPWNTLNADEKKLFSHMAEVCAGFSEYTDVADRPDHRLPASSPGSSTTRSSSMPPTTAPPARARRTAPSTRTSSSTAIPMTSPRT